MKSIDKEMSRYLSAWPSERRFSVDEVLTEHPEFANDSLAIEQLVLEEYVRRLEAGERLCPSTFCQQFSSLSPVLTRQLRNVADVHQRHGLLVAGADIQRQFPEPGDEVNGYTLVEEIGRGAFSHVFLAKDGHVADRQVVVKTTYHGGAEVELLGPMSHPHLPRIFYCQLDPETGITTICMDWIGDRTLNDLLATLHSPDESSDAEDRVSFRQIVPRAVDVVRQIADGLAYAHEQNVLHLDVKPSNILLRDDGTAVLIDFNLAVTASQSQNVGFRGTLAYAAPEVIATAVQEEEAPHTVTEAADVFSLGTVFYELLTGDLPFPDVPSGPVEQAAHATLRSKQILPPCPSQINPAVDPRLDQIVLKALSADPQDRYASAQEFHAALLAYSPPEPRTTRRRLAVAALGVAVVVSAVYLARFHGPTQELSVKTSPDLVDIPPTVRLERDLTTGWEFVLANDPGQALQCFERASESSDDPRLEASIAFTKMVIGSYDEALERIIQVNRSYLSADAGVQCTLAYCHLKTNRAGRGTVHYLDRTLRDSPRNERALFLRAIVESRKTEDPATVTPYVDRLLKMNTTSSHLTADAVITYDKSNDIAVVNERLAAIGEVTAWTRTDIAGGVVRALLPDFVRTSLNWSLDGVQPTPQADTSY